MKRDEWEFEYTAAKLADAAEQQRDFRNGRVTAWEAKKEEVMRKIKDSGLTVHEGPAASMSNYTSVGGGGAYVMVDQTLQSDLSQCVAKIEAHRSAAAEYDGWVRVLRGNPEKRVVLHHDDWLYFFGTK